MKSSIPPLLIVPLLILSKPCPCFSTCGCDSLKLIMKDKIVLSKLKTENDTLCLIKCLLKFRTDGRPNDVWSTYTKDSDEIVFSKKQSSSNPYRPHAPNNIVALYLITALFKNDFEFCNRLILVDSSNYNDIKYISNIKEKYEKGKFHRMYGGSLAEIRYSNTQSKEVKLIYKDVLKWYKTVEKTGLSYARKNSIEPIPKTRKIKWW